MGLVTVIGQWQLGFNCLRTKGRSAVDKQRRLNFNWPLLVCCAKYDAVFVGRLRRDETQPRTLNLWIVADNLRKGAATNAVQIAELLVGKGLVVSGKRTGASFLGQ